MEKLVYLLNADAQASGADLREVIAVQSNVETSGGNVGAISRRQMRSQPRREVVPAPPNSNQYEVVDLAAFHYVVRQASESRLRFLFRQDWCARTALRGFLGPPAARLRDRAAVYPPPAGRSTPRPCVFSLQHPGA